MIKKIIFIGLLTLFSYGCGPRKRVYIQQNSAQASNISIWNSYIDYLDNNEINTYRVILKANKCYSVETFNLSIGMDTVIRIFDTGGLLIAENDNNLDLESKIEIRMQRTGEYHIVVSNNTASANTESYNIILTEVDCDEDACEEDACDEHHKHHHHDD